MYSKDSSKESNSINAFYNDKNLIYILSFSKKICKYNKIY